MHPAQEVLFGQVDRPIGLRDGEQSVQHLLQRFVVVGVGFPQLQSKGFETVGAVAGLVEQPADVAGGLGGDAEAALEGVDFQARYGAVTFGQLGRQHDNGGAEQLLPPAEHRGHTSRAERAVGLAEIRHGAAVGGVAQSGAHHHPDRPAHGEAGDAADDLTPVSHTCLLARRPGPGQNIQGPVRTPA